MADPATSPSDLLIQEKISSLPRGKDWTTDDLYLYQGFWYPSRLVESIIECQETKEFSPRSTDIFLASSPKCGTTWLKALGFAVVHRSKFPNFDSTHPLHTTNPHACVHEIEFGFVHKKSFSEVENMSDPRVLATHLPFTSLPETILGSDSRIVYICRDPKDMFVSYWLFRQKVTFGQAHVASAGDNSLENAFEHFCKGTCAYGPYWDHVLGYFKASLEFPDRILFLKYEEMHCDTVNQVKRMAEFLGCPFSSKEVEKGVVEEIIHLCSFENLKSLEVNKKEEYAFVNNNAFFRKGKVGDSENYLTPDMIERLERITDEKFHGFQISF